MTSGDRTPALHIHPRARVLLPIFLVVLGAFSIYRFGCDRPSPATLQFHGQTMGTTWNATVVRPQGEVHGRAGTVIQLALNQVDSLMSTWKPDSELMRFNRNTTTEPVEASADLAEVMAIALEVSQKSGGAFDITVLSLVELHLQAFEEPCRVFLPSSARDPDLPLSFLTGRVPYPVSSQLFSWVSLLSLKGWVQASRSFSPA